MTFPGVGFFGPRKWPAQYMPAQITSATPNMMNIGRYCASIFRLGLWGERAEAEQRGGSLGTRVRSDPAQHAGHDRETKRQPKQRYRPQKSRKMPLFRALDSSLAESCQ